MPPAKGNPQHLTLRLKQSTFTTLLLVEPTQSFEQIASDLLAALHEVYSDGRLPNGELIPDSPDQVLLGTPNDVTELDGAGYSLLWPADGAGDVDEDVKSSKKRSRSDTNTPQNAGLKNGAVLAYKFRVEGDGEEMDLDIGWDVKMPKYEEEE